MGLLNQTQKNQPTISENVLNQDLKLTARPKGTLQKLLQKLPAGVQQIGSDLKQGLFGSVEPDITGAQRQVGGLLKRGDTKLDKVVDDIVPFRLLLPKSKEVRYFETYDPLKQAGIDPFIADQIAQGKIQPEGVRAVSQGLPAIPVQPSLTKAEKTALKPLRTEETLDKVFGALDLISFGTTGKVGKGLYTAIAKSRNAGDILTLLSKELPSIPEPVRRQMSTLLRNVDNADEVERVFNRARLAAQDAGKVAPDPKSEARVFKTTDIQGNTVEQQFAREATKLEIKSPTAKSKGYNSIPDKEGYEKVFKPYGEDGAGYYYSKEVTAPLEGVSNKALSMTRDELQTLISIKEEALQNNPARELQKYSPSRGDNKGTIPEVLGAGGKFAKGGDDIITQLGFEDSEQARRAFEDYLVQKEELGVLKQQLKDTRPLKFGDDGRPIALNPRQQAIRDKAIADRANNQASLETTQAPLEATTLPESETRSLEQTLSTQDLGGKIDIPESIKGDSEKVVSYNNSIQQKILNARDARAALDEFLSVSQEPGTFPEQTQRVRDIANGINLRGKAPKYEDIGNTKKQLRDIYRNSQQVLGDDFKVIEREIFNPFDKSKGAYIRTLESELDQLQRNVVDKFNIQKGSKESQWIQKYGEGDKTLDEVVKVFGEKRANDIVQADKWFRNKYDDLIDRVNVIEQKIYPNNPEKWTPKLENYYRHFSELSNTFSRLQDILNNPVRIDPMLVGVSEGTKPKSKWASFKQRRLGTKTTEDAVGGFLNYLPSASYAIHIDPHIGAFRELADVLRRSTGKTKNINNYIYNLDKFANQLSGKTNDFDRIVTEIVPGGRTSLQAVDWVNKRVKANTILGNVSSSLAQIFNVPQGIASSGKINSLKAFYKTLAQNFIENGAMKKSDFLKERYFKGFNKFDKGILNNTKKFAIWMVNALDEAGTKFIWNGQYEKALQLGVKDPISYADKNTRKLVGGRGIGEKPLLQESKTFQVVAPFQLEVTNLWWAMQDLARENPKILSKIDKFLTLFVSMYLLNSAAEEIRGSRVALDPIDAVMDAVAEIIEEPNLEGSTKAGGRLAGEVLSNVPLGQTIASMYPEYGTTIGGVKIPTRRELFGRADPTRFGGGLLSTKALSDPIYKILPPFGGSQIKKTVGGIGAVREGVSTRKDGDKQFPVGGSLLKDTQAILFGKYSGEGARDFFDNNVSYAESVTNRLLESPETAAEEFEKIREEDPDLAKKIEKVMKDRELGVTDKEKKMRNLGVANGARTEAVMKQLDKLDTEEEKAALWEDYVVKKIITEDVSTQLIVEIMAREFNELKTEEEKSALWDDYVAKNVITEDVADQLIKKLK